MALLACCADGDFTSSATWALVDSTSYLGAESGSDILTTAYSGTRSSAFTPGAITIDGIGVKLAVRTGTTGTISVNLELDSDNSQVAGTEVTINCSDLPAAATVIADGGWIFFKFGTPVTLAGATAYQVAAKTSNASQVSLFRDGTVDNISRYLRTTTTQAPAAGDDLIITKEWTAAATGTDRAVTMNETATTDYGSAPTAANSLLTPGLAICQGGTLTYGTTAATNYYLKESNSVIVYNSGTLNIGTTGTPIPRDGTAVLEFDPGTDGDYGLICRNGSTVNFQGLSRTSGKNIVSCKLNTDEAVDSTSLGVDTDTGWLDNDQIVVASTTRTASQSEVGALNGNAGASSLTVDGFGGAGGGLANAHSGTSPTQAEVINITRNVKVRSASSTLMAYVRVDEGSAVDFDWAEFYYLGENATGKRGIELVPAGSNSVNFSMQFCSIHDTEDVGFQISIASNAITNLIFSSNVMWNLATVIGPGCQISSAITSTDYTIDSNILIKTGAGNGWTLSDIGGTFTNNTVVSAASNGINLAEANTFGTITGNVSHSNTAAGVAFASNGMNGSASLTAWRNTSFGLSVTATFSGIVTITAFGNGTSNISIAATGVDFKLSSPVLNGDSTFSTTNNINATTGGSVIKLLIDDGDLSSASGILTAATNDINVSTSPLDYQVILRNTKLGASTEVASQSNLIDTGYIAAQKLDQTAGNHKTWMRAGTLQRDTTILAPSGNASMRATPNNASLKLESAYQFWGWKVPVLSGNTVNIEVEIRKSDAGAGDSATYNGNQPRLIQKANPALGESADVVIATYSAGTGSWNQISGTSSVANDDGAWEFVFDCDGTAGWINGGDPAAS